jgi:RecA/RadA recombinase
VTVDGAVVRSLAARVRPVVLAREQALDVPGPLGPLLDGGLVRGSVLVVDGALGTGRTSVLLHLLAAVTAAGEWAAVVAGPGEAGLGLPGPRAASEAGVDLARLAYVRDVPAARWATVVAALLDGCTAVAADPPPTLLRSDARRLLARVRQRRAVLLTDERWPERTARRIRVVGSEWTGLGPGEGRLGERELTLEVLDRTRRLRAARVGELADAG